jgi:catechol 2,3-dioxygenase-like lactoylglutathione lyase family enzyme
MTSTQVSRDESTTTDSEVSVPLRLEVVILPVTDVDRARNFYQGLGWRLDADIAVGNYHLVQMTPPASNASIIFGQGVTTGQPGSGALLLAVDDIDRAREQLIARGADVSEPFHDDSGSLGGGFHDSPATRAAGPDPEGRSYATYASFSDPDGNQWLLQEITTRLPGRLWE